MVAAAGKLLLPGVLTPDGQKETQGLAIQEAQAAGLLVVAWCVGGVAECITDGVTGFLLRPYQVAETIERLAILTESEDLRSRVFSAARDFSLNRYKPSDLAEQAIQALVQSSHKL